MTRTHWPRSPPPAVPGTFPRSGGWRTWRRPGPRSGWAARGTGGVRERRRSARRPSSPRSASRAGDGGQAEPESARGRSRPTTAPRTRCWPSSTRRTGRHPGRAALRGGQVGPPPSRGGAQREDQGELFAIEDMPSPRKRHRAAPEDGLTPADREVVAAWERDAGLLLAERDRQQRRGDGPIPVMLPARLSVSALVALARDPDELARQVRRPMPQPPARQARRGTEFHRWLEERFGQPRLISDDDLFADPDEPSDAALAQLREKFQAGEWGDRWPREVEVPFDTLIGDRQIRGRIDAVFADGRGRRVRRRGLEDRPAAAQASRKRTPSRSSSPPTGLPGQTLAGVPLDQVRAAFYYVRHDLTVRPGGPARRSRPQGPDRPRPRGRLALTAQLPTTGEPEVIEARAVPLIEFPAQPDLPPGDPDRVGRRLARTSINRRHPIPGRAARGSG